MIITYICIYILKLTRDGFRLHFLIKFITNVITYVLKEGKRVRVFYSNHAILKMVRQPEVILCSCQLIHGAVYKTTHTHTNTNIYMKNDKQIIVA